jgi:DNA-directed RNA polymerase specialized sigma24 family protein
LDITPLTKTDWELTREAFAKLLDCLDADSQRAAERYESIRRTLVKFFDWRGSNISEELADETLNRLIRKLDEGDRIRDVATYSYGVARLVFLESLKGPASKHTPLEEAGELIAAADHFTEDYREDEDRQYECFEKCLESLPAGGRETILEYYKDERRAKIDHRRLLADRLGIPINALRSRAQRLRDRLEKCVEECLKPT